MILSDQTLARRQAEENIISPYNPTLVRKNDSCRIISAGQSSYGYDVMLAPDVEIFTNISSTVIDPKKTSPSALVKGKVRISAEGRFVILPPNSYLLGHTKEHFNIPRDLMVLCLGKSTYARAGIIINTTPIEPGFQGQVVIEVSNSTSLPVRIYVDEGIAQFLFLQGDIPCKVSYADRDGKYQGQSGIRHASV